MIERLHDIVDNWTWAREKLKPAIERSRGAISLESVLIDLINGDLQLWAADDDIACLTDIRPSRTGRVKYLNFYGAGGEGLQHLKDMKEIEEWGRTLGCNRGRIEGRPGWARLLPDYRQTAVILEKDL